MLKIIRRVLRLSGKLIETDLGQLYLWLSGIHVRPAANRRRLSCPDRIAERSTDYRTNMGYCYRLDCRRFNPAHDFQISGLPGCKVRQALSL